MKFADVDVVDDSVTNAWALVAAAHTTLSGVTEGNGQSERIGRKYSIHSIHLKGQVWINHVESMAGPPGDRQVRLVLVWDKQTNGAAFTPSSVMLAPDEEINGFRNLENTKRFRVLWDEVIDLPQLGLSQSAVNAHDTGTRSVCFKKSIQFKTPIQVTCTGTTNGVSSISDNNINLMACESDKHSAGDTRTLNLNYNCRLRYTG